MKFASVVLVLVSIAVAAFFGYYYTNFFRNKSINSPIEKQGIKQKPLERYAIEKLGMAQFQPSDITIGETLKDETKYTSRIFYFDVEGKKVSGLINLPKASGTYPVIVMLRGYVDKEIYQTGVGTQRAGEVFAQNGYITLAPDFLGYGQSDQPSESSIEERFQTYTTALTLLSSIPNLNKSIGTQTKADSSRIGLWGHSNGGQISLTVLEITQKPYPTVLWAPVSKPFPYSILYYTDDFDDRGKALRKVVADFEKDYDVELFSLPNYLQRITAPIQLHQGSADDAVPIQWSNILNESLKKLDKKVQYFIYPGADHNLLGGWSSAVERSISFYNSNLR